MLVRESLLCLTFSSFLFDVQFLSFFLEQGVVLVHMLLVRLSVPEDRIVQGTRSGSFLWVVLTSMLKQLLLGGKIDCTIFKNTIISLISLL